MHCCACLCFVVLLGVFGLGCLSFGLIHKNNLVGQLNDQCTGQQKSPPVCTLVLHLHIKINPNPSLLRDHFFYALFFSTSATFL